MIRIAYVIDTIEGPTAGTEKQLLMLLRHQDRTRFDPILCVLRSSRWLEEEFRLCPVHEIGIRTFKDPRVLVAMGRFVRLLKTERVSVVHSFFRDGMRVGITAGRLAGVRLNIAGIRSQGFWMTSADCKIMRILHRWTNLTIVNCQDTKDWMIQSEGVSADAIHVIHNGVETDTFGSTPANARARIRADLGIPPEAPTAGVVANLRPVKAHDVFLQAAKRVVASQPDVHFVLVGEGSERSRLEHLASTLGVRALVHFLGERRDIPEILAALDVGILSSHSESFSNSIVEYMAAGLPVVATDVGGAREAVEDGVTGILVPPGDDIRLADAVLSVLARGSGVDMGEAGRRRAVERFGISTMVRLHEEIYSRSEEHP